MVKDAFSFLTPVHQNMTLFGNKVFTNIEVKMRPLGS